MEVAMTKNKNKALKDEMKALFTQDVDFMESHLRKTIRQILDAEMEELLGVAHHERSNSRKGYRAGFYNRTLITRIGKIELRAWQRCYVHFL